MAFSSRFCIKINCAHQRRVWYRVPMTGAELITAERQRQIDVEGWTSEHDDEHEDSELTKASRAYAWVALCEVNFEARAKDFDIRPNDWPKEWGGNWFKPSDDPVRNLVKAGALIAAEIDRLQRKEEHRDSAVSKL